MKMAINGLSPFPDSHPTPNTFIGVSRTFVLRISEMVDTYHYRPHGRTNSREKSCNQHRLHVLTSGLLDKSDYDRRSQ